MGVVLSHINRRKGRRAIAALAVVSALLACAGLALGDLPHARVQVASGKFEGQAWTLAVGRHEGERCFRLALANNLVQSSVTACEPKGRPRKVWQHVVGVSHASASVELNVTTPKVRRLKLLLERPNTGRQPTWTTLPTEELTAAGARAAHLQRNFRYAVVTGRGSLLCVTEVRAYSGSGRLLESLSMPCEA